MYILLDSRSETRTGVGRHAQNYRRLLPQLSETTRFDILLSSPEKDYDNCHFILDRSPRYSHSETLKVSSLLRTGKYSLFHSFDFTLPFVTSTPLIATIHDLTRLKQLEYYHNNIDFVKRYGLLQGLNLFRIALASTIRYSEIQQIIYKSSNSNVGNFRFRLHLYHHLFMLLRAKYQATHIITVSQSTKADICNYLDIPNNKVTVVYNGVSSTFRLIENASYLEATRQRMNLPQEFFLYVGLWRHHKNISIMLHALHSFIQKHGKQISLVLVGKQDRHEKHVIATIRKLNLDDNVFFTGYVSGTDLVAIYNLAVATIVPSKYEGFGLPALESLACGTPVIASNISSLKEILGDSGLYFDPEKVQNLVEAMQLILENRSLRLDIASKGLKLVEKYRWESGASKIKSIHDRIMVEENRLQS